MPRKSVTAARAKFEGVGVDLLQGGGSLAQRILMGGIGPHLRANSTLSEVSKALRGREELKDNSGLPYDAWREVDDAVSGEAQRRMVITKAIIGAGNVVNLTNPLGTFVFTSQKMSDIEGAQVDMDLDTESPNDRPDINFDNLPIPVVHAGFSYSIRELEAAMNGNMPLDTTTAGLCGRLVMERIEQISSIGESGLVFNGSTIYGITNHPDVTAYELAAAWDDSAADPVEDVRQMKQEMINNRQYGPYVLFVCTAYETILDKDYSDNYQKTMRQRILEIGGVQSVQVVDWLPENSVVLIQLDPVTVRMILGWNGALQTVEWDTAGGLRVHYKVFGVYVPQIRSDYSGRCGIVVGEPAA